MRDALVVVVSDIHGNSTLAGCPPQGFVAADGDTRRPSKLQQWIYEGWDHFWHQEVKPAAKGRTLYGIVNGEFVEGFHHGSTQHMSANPADQMTVSQALMKVPMELFDWEAWFATKGTGSHSGTNGYFDELMARWLGAEEHPSTRQSAAYRWNIEINGCALDVAHHGKVGMLPWTEDAAIARLAKHVAYRYVERGLELPDLIIRSHVHKCFSTGRTALVEAWTTPCWQMKTEFGHKIAEGLPDIGGLLVRIDGDGAWDVEDIIYEAEPDPVWQSISRKAS